MSVAFTVYRHKVNEWRQPPPHVVVYAAWLEEQPARGGERTMSPALLRRMVVLRRAGDTWAEIARCCCVPFKTLRVTWDRLPEELR